MDESLAPHPASIDLKNKTLVLTSDQDKNWKANFTFERPAADHMTLDGKMDGHTFHMQLKLMDRNRFMLINRGFHWIQEYPFSP